MPEGQTQSDPFCTKGALQAEQLLAEEAQFEHPSAHNSHFPVVKFAYLPGEQLCEQVTCVIFRLLIH
jgi:hypothetical protein